MMTTAHAKKILILEDNPDIRKTLCLRLENTPYEVIETESIASAFQVLEHVKCDLLILDIEVSDGNALDHLKAERKLGKYQDLPVIILTGNGSMSNLTTSVFLDVDHYLNKPVDGKKLVSIIDQYMQVPKSNQAEV